MKLHSHKSFSAAIMRYFAHHRLTPYVQVMEHVAAELGVDAEALREANFLKPPPTPAPAPALTPPAATIEVATTGDGAAGSSPSNDKEGTAVAVSKP